MVRCFRRLPKGELRHGIWIMTRDSGARGAFFHGDRNEIQAPKWTVEELMAPGTFCEPISQDEALAELANWPDAVTNAKAIFERHRNDP